MTMPATIVTGRLELRPLERADAGAISALMTFPVARFLTSVPWPYHPEDAHAFLAAVAGRQGQYAVTHEGRLIGTLGGTTELGYWLGEAYWGRGYATEAAAAYRDAWFATGAARLRSAHATANGASARVLEKTGLVADGFRVAMLNRGRERAVLRTVSMRRADWQALTARADSGKRRT